MNSEIVREISGWINSEIVREINIWLNRVVRDRFINK